MTRERPRPSPDALLAQATRAGRGRLKILLGAAPGVGKTYEMLSEGAQRQRAGVDVVVGVVETHGRADTAALTEGLEILAAGHGCGAVVGRLAQWRVLLVSTIGRLCHAACIAIGRDRNPLASETTKLRFG